jgi:hypothetical protein
VPVPLRLTTRGALEALSLIAIDALIAPLTLGANLTEIEQLFPAATDPLHVLVWVKAVLIVIPARLSVALPVLLSVTVLAELLVPTACLPKARLDGLTEPTGAGVGVDWSVGVGLGVGEGVGAGVGVGEGVGVALGIGAGDAALSNEITETE